VGEGRTGEPQANQRLTVSQAATALGITEGAVRSRIKRGTLPTTKEGGTVFVLLGKPGAPLGGTPQANQTPNTGVPTDQTELIETLRDEVNLLTEEREASRRKDHLLAAALERIPPAIEAPRDQEPPESTLEEASEESDRDEPQGTPKSGTGGPQEAAQRRSWWRRMFGG
jgi:hypothetical protein